MSLLSQVALGSLTLAFVCFLVAALGSRWKSGSSVFLGMVLGAFLLMTGLLAGVLAIGTQGYRALTQEEVAAIVHTERIDDERFRAHFQFPEGDTLSVTLLGDELYVDAHILKWKPWVNFLGLHTEYELDRVAGRYADLEDEQTSPRTVYSIARRKPFDLFDVARNRPVLLPVVDAEYGSASFVPAEGTYELRVSTSGLLFRLVEEPDPEAGSE
jgi:hypothetical protein